MINSAVQWILSVSDCLFCVVVSAAVPADAPTGIVLSRLGVDILAETAVRPRSEFIALLPLLLPPLLLLSVIV